MSQSKLSFHLFVFVIFSLFSTYELWAATIDSIPIGKGSLPARLFPDGTVCLVDDNNPSVCQKKLVTIPRRVMKAHSFTFYGVFDMDGNGSPDVFVGYWPHFIRHDSDHVVLLVYKKVHGKYRQYLRLKAESYGYDPGAWFLNETPYSKALFKTRYGGSSGSGLFYLNLKTKSLDLISGSVFMEGDPEFIDLNGDGMAAVFLPGRGRDRTSKPGAAILHWNGQEYEKWWPDWIGAPHVIYAALADLERDGKKEIVAVMEPENNDLGTNRNGITSGSRELATWKFTKDGLSLISKVNLPDARYLSEPSLRITSSNPGIEVIYSRTVGCTIRGSKLECKEEN